MQLHTNSSFSAIKALFPNTDHQLCFVHMQKNIKKKMTKEDVKAFYEERQLIKKMKDFDKADLSLIKTTL